ncbi:MAG: DUF6273 domain-containing protein [Clostridia bacterium]
MQDNSFNIKITLDKGVLAADIRKALAQIGEEIALGLSTHQFYAHNHFTLHMAEIQRIAPFAHLAFRCGDIITTPCHNDFEGGSIDWIVIEHDAGFVKLWMKNVLSDKQPFGLDNMWSTSSLRAWLNDESSGFLSGFSVEDRAAITPTELITYKDDKPISTSDRVFILSASEMAFTRDDGIDLREGDPYAFFREAKDADWAMSTHCKTFEDGTPASHWVRSPYPWDTDIVRLVTPSGTVVNSGAYGAHGVAAALTIRSIG